MSDINTLPAPLRADDDLIIPISERKTVETLLANDCRWPFGDPMSGDFHFCGKQKKDGSPYCEFHVRRAFQAAKPRPAVYRPHAA
jgi:GcrA cell cycle regulator